MIGIDVGGTNTDAAVVSEEIFTIKLPNELGLGRVLEELSKHVDLKSERLVISTSIALNFVISKFNEIKTLTLLIPGPGLNYSNYGVVLKGCVNHRGDVVEGIDKDEVRRALNGRYDNVAIASKFSVRNPKLEEDVKCIALEKFKEEEIALSYPIGILNYPLRINTTVLNAKIKKTIFELTNLIKKYVDRFYYYKGDGGIIPYELALQNPSLLYNSSPAAVAFGAYYLTREENCLVIDIGGTSTDFVPLKNGKPKIVEKAEIAGMRTAIRCVDSFSIPFGGDSVVRNGKLMPERLDKPIAFGGKYFTLTDALNCIGYEIGNYKASREAGKEIFRDLNDFEVVVDQFLSNVADLIKQTEYDKIVGAGYLAPMLIPEIAKRANVSYKIPKHCEAVNAIGVAVSKVSLSLYARYDTTTGRAVYNGKVEKCPFGMGTIPDDDEIVKSAIDKLISLAKEFGEEDIGDVRVLYFNSYAVVRGGIRRGKIADVIVQIEPGIRNG